MVVSLKTIILAAVNLKQMAIMKKNIFTIDVSDIINEEGIMDARTCVDYNSEDEAINVAKEIANDFSSDNNVIEISVFAGEYENENGDVFGEPFDIFTATNVSKEKSVAARKQANYVKETVDYYAR